MKELIERIRNAEELVTLTPADNDQIQAAEKTLNLRFAEDFREYLKTFGAASFEQRELTGISKSSRLNVTAVTQRARAYYHQFPLDAYVVEEAHVDHVVTIQKRDGTVWQYGPQDTAVLLAASLNEYLFGRTENKG